MEQRIATDEDERRSDGGEEDAKDGQLNGLLADAANLADRVDELVEKRIRRRGADLAPEEGEREELERAIESRLNNLGVGGIEREKEWLKDGICIGGGETEERR